MPCSMALRAAESAARPAAYGVLLREPLKPAAPDDPQVKTLPSGSVMVTIVLLELCCSWIECTRCHGVHSFARDGGRGQRRVRFDVRPYAGYFFAAAFLRPATVLRGPLRVRALVRVRWPWTGKPRRWRT